MVVLAVLVALVVLAAFMAPVSFYASDGLCGPVGFYGPGESGLALMTWRAHLILVSV